MFFSLTPLHAAGPHHLSHAKVAQWNWSSWTPPIFSGLLISQLSFQTCLPPQILVAQGGAGKEGAKPQTRKGRKGGKTYLQYQVNWFTGNCKRDPFPLKEMQQTKSKMMKFHNLANLLASIAIYNTACRGYILLPKEQNMKYVETSDIPNPHLFRGWTG